MTLSSPPQLTLSISLTGRSRGGYQNSSYLSASGNGTNGKYMDSSPVLIPAIGTKMNSGLLQVQQERFETAGEHQHHRPFALPCGRSRGQHLRTASWTGWTLRIPGEVKEHQFDGRPTGDGNLVGNAILSDVTWSNVQSLFGGGTLTMEMYDNQSGNSGTAPDTLGIQVTDNKGNL